MLLLFLPYIQVEEYSANQHGIKAFRQCLGQEQVGHDILAKPCHQEIDHIADEKAETKDAHLCRQVQRKKPFFKLPTAKPNTVIEME